MHLHPLLVAGFGAVVAAAPSPIIISSPILTPQVCGNNPAVPVVQGLSDAASICSQLLPTSSRTAVRTETLTQTSTETVTATVTETDAQTATATVSTVAQTTETTIVDGPTDISTNTITKTATITETATATAFSNGAVTTTVYPRDTALDFRKNKNKKKRDQCQAKPKPSNSTNSASLNPTLTSTAASSSTIKNSNPLGSFPTDVVSAACSCLGSIVTVTDTVTITTTVTASPSATSTATVTVSSTLATDVVTVTFSTTTATTTSTAPGLTSTVETQVAAATPATVTVTTTTTQAAPTTTVTATSPHFFVVADYGNAHAIPSRRRQVFQDVPDIPLTVDGIFQFCATQCVADPGCTKIWIARNRPITREGLWCVTGGTDADFFADVQQNYPGIGAEGTYYDTVAF